jgi:hypothetical protein
LKSIERVKFFFVLIVSGNSKGLRHLASFELCPEAENLELDQRANVDQVFDGDRRR